MRRAVWVVALVVFAGCADSSARAADRAVCDEVGPMIASGPRVLGEIERVNVIEGLLDDVERSDIEIAGRDLVAAADLVRLGGRIGREDSNRDFLVLSGAALKVDDLCIKYHLY